MKTKNQQPKEKTKIEKMNGFLNWYQNKVKGNYLTNIQFINIMNRL